MTHDTVTAEQYQRALLEETLLSLIRDPSRWSWERAGEDAGIRGRLRQQAHAANRCPGWMCGAVMEAPLLPGQYCSAECKQQAWKAREAFRCDLHQLRSGLARWCEACGTIMLGRRPDARFCSRACRDPWYALRYYREHSSHAPLFVSVFRTSCRGCGAVLSAASQRRHAQWCSPNCRLRTWKRAQRELKQAREAMP